MFKRVTRFRSLGVQGCRGLGVQWDGLQEEPADGEVDDETRSCRDAK